MSNMAKRVYPQVPPVNTHTVLTRPVRVIIPQQNAVIVVQNPPVSDGTTESFKNNPICTVWKFVEGKGLVQVPVRHPELVMKKCIISNCEECHCTSFCAKPLEEDPQSFAHVTHGNPPGAQSFMNKDLGNNNVPENVVPYTSPHTVEQLNENSKKTESIQDSTRKEAMINLLKQIREYRKNDNQEDK